jgi:hypothetical protein
MGRVSCCSEIKTRQLALSLEGEDPPYRTHLINARWARSD